MLSCIDMTKINVSNQKISQNFHLLYHPVSIFLSFGSNDFTPSFSGIGKKVGAVHFVLFFTQTSLQERQSRNYYFHFADEETDQQRNCDLLRVHSQSVTEDREEPMPEPCSYFPQLWQKEKMTTLCQFLPATYFRQVHSSVLVFVFPSVQ